MYISEVKSKKEEKDFLDLPWYIYKNDPNWIPPLDTDVKPIFDPEKNTHFENGELVRWVVYDTHKKPVGRIAAFIHKNIAFTYETPTAAIGFFESINDQQVAFLLFDTAKNWLQGKGIMAMDGPVNFGEKDRFWGLLVKGFGKPTPYLINYNPPYYIELFEAYGFQNYYEQYIYNISRDAYIPPLVQRSFKRLEDQGYEFTSMKLNEMDKYARDFMEIYNHAWQDVHKHFKPMTFEQAQKTFKSMKAVVDEDLAIFAYHHQKPVAVFIGIPELNQIFQYVNGKFNVWGKIKFMFFKWLKRVNSAYGIVFGIVPEHRNKGVESGLILSIQKAVVSKNKYKNMYIAWIGDFNPKMIRIVEILTKNREFTLVTYRKLFDEKQKFERHAPID